MSETHQCGVPNWRTFLLRAVFAISVAWAMLLAFSEDLFANLPENGSRPVTEGMMLAAVAASAGVLTFALCKVWPRFLRVPEETGFLAWLGGWFAAAVASFILIGIVFGAVEYAHLRLTGDPDNPQYGLSVIMASTWYPIALTPLLATMVIWVWMSRCSRRRCA